MWFFFHIRLFLCSLSPSLFSVLPIWKSPLYTYPQIYRSLGLCEESSFSHTHYCRHFVLPFQVRKKTNIWAPECSKAFFLLNSSADCLRVTNKLFELFTENDTHSSIRISLYYHQLPLQSVKRNRHFWLMIHLIFSSNPLRRRWLVSCKHLFLSAEKAQNLGTSQTLTYLL